VTYAPLAGLGALRPKDANGNAVVQASEKAALGVFAASFALAMLAAHSKSVAEKKAKAAAAVKAAATSAETGLLADRYRVTVDDSNAKKGRYGLSIQPSKAAASPYLEPTLSPSDIGLSAKYDPYWEAGGVGQAIPEEVLDQLVADLRAFDEGSLSSSFDEDGLIDVD
jgi:hypothetical protein